MKSVVRRIIDVFTPDKFSSTLAYRLGTMYMFKTNREDLMKLIESSDDDSNITLGFELMNGDINLYAVDLEKVNIAVKMIRSMRKHKDRSISDISSLSRILRDIDKVNQKVNKKKWL